jgi:predicted ABC-type ATPase
VKRPSIVIVAGVNGCGKSTFAATAAGRAALLGQTAINPDQLTQEASAQVPELGATGANLVGVERAEKAVWRAIAEGKSAAIETVLSSTKFLPLLQAKQAAAPDPSHLHRTPDRGARTGANSIACRAKRA